MGVREICLRPIVGDSTAGGTNDYARAVDLPPIKAQMLLRGWALSQDELDALSSVCAVDPTPAEVRDAALLAILGRAGLRRSEASALDLGDYDDGALTVCGGKGCKDWITYVEVGREAVEARIAVRGSASGALLCSVDKRGCVTVRPITDQAIMFPLQRRAKAAGVAAFSSHDLRRTFISDLLDVGADIATVQKLAGHASPHMTAKYDRRREATKRRAVGCSISLIVVGSFCSTKMHVFLASSSARNLLQML